MVQVTASLRELVKNNVDFHWLGEQEQIFSTIKQLISSALVLKFLTVLDKLFYAFAFTKYHNSVYDHKILVQSDHKPFLSIVENPISKILFGLQKMLLQLLKHNCWIGYLCDCQIHVAEALSQVYLKDNILDDPEILSTVHRNSNKGQ